MWLSVLTLVIKMMEILARLGWALACARMRIPATSYLMPRRVW